MRDENNKVGDCEMIVQIIFSVNENSLQYLSAIFHVSTISPLLSTASLVDGNDKLYIKWGMILKWFSPLSSAPPNIFYIILGQLLTFSHSNPSFPPLKISRTIHESERKRRKRRKNVEERGRQGEKIRGR